MHRDTRYIYLRSPRIKLPMTLPTKPVYLRKIQAVHQSITSFLSSRLISFPSHISVPLSKPSCPLVGCPHLPKPFPIPNQNHTIREIKWKRKSKTKKKTPMQMQKKPKKVGTNFFRVRCLPRFVTWFNS